MIRILLLPLMGGLPALTAVDNSMPPAQRPGGGAAALSEPLVGITVDGLPVRGLFPVRATGVSTAPVREVAVAFLHAGGKAGRAVKAGRAR